MKKFVIALGLVLTTSASYADDTNVTVNLCVGNCASRAPRVKQEPVDYLAIWRMRLSSEDSEFIKQSVKLLPTENVRLNELELKFLTFRGSRELTQDDKLCFARQLRAFQDAKDYFKDMPVPLNFAQFEYNAAGNGQVGSHHPYASYSDYPSGTIYFTLNANYNSDTKKCDFSSSDEIKNEITKAIDEHNAEVAKKESIKQSDESIIRDLLSNGKQVQSSQSDLRDPKVATDSTKRISNLIFDRTEVVSEDTVAGSAW